MVAAGVFVLTVVAVVVVGVSMMDDDTSPAHPTPSIYVVTVHTEPPTATVAFDGSAAGVGAAVASFPMDTRGHLLRVTAPGFTPVSLLVDQNHLPPAVIRLIADPTAR